MEGKVHAGTGVRKSLHIIDHNSIFGVFLGMNCVCVRKGGDVVVSMA